LFQFRKKPKKSVTNQPAASKAAALPSGSDKGASAAIAAGATGKTSARPTLISARGPPATDRPGTKIENLNAEENEKYKIQIFNFFFEKKIFIFRKKTSKGEVRSAAIREEIDAPNALAKVSVTSDADDEKEKKKDRELLIK
jgi:hypothetical protein